MRRWRTLSLVVGSLVMAAWSLLAVAPPTSGTTPGPSITGFVATPATVAFSGGSSTLSASVTNATSCVVSSSVTVAGLPQTIDCSGGSVSVPVTLPANALDKAVSYTFTLSATGAKTVKATTKASVAGEPIPTVTDFVATPPSQPFAAGPVTVSATLANAQTCTLTSSPLVTGLPESSDCSSGTLSVPVTLPANAKGTTRTYKLKLSVTGSKTVKATTTATVGGEPAPVITALNTSPASQPSTGGPITVSASVTDATSCTLSAKPALTGFPQTTDCSSGSISASAILPANTAKTTKTYTFSLSAKGSSTVEAATTATVLTQSAEPAPVISGFAATPPTVSSSGGSVTLGATVTNATSCTVTSSPSLASLPQTVNCSSGTLSIPVTLPADATSDVVTYTFSLSATGSSTTQATPTTAVVEAVPSNAPVVHVSGSLTSNTTWSPGQASAYIIDGSLDVPAGVTLTIAPGTVLKALHGYNLCGGYYQCSLSVEGTLNAVGTAAQPITFTSINDNSVGGDTGTGSPASGDWNGIYTGDSGSVNIQFTTITYAVNAVSAVTSGSGSNLSNVLIENSATGLIDLEGSIAVRGSLVNNGTEVDACDWGSNCSVDAAYVDWGSDEGPFSANGPLACGSVTVSPWLPNNVKSTTFDVKNCDSLSTPDVQLSDAVSNYEERIDGIEIECGEGYQDFCQELQQTESCLAGADAAAWAASPVPAPSADPVTAGTTYTTDALDIVDAFLQGAEQTVVTVLDVGDFGADIVGAASALIALAHAYNSC
jgi:hypothetical protein